MTNNYKTMSGHKKVYLIKGVKYQSMQEAAKAHGVTINVFKSWINSGNYYRQKGNTPDGYKIRVLSFVTKFEQLTAQRKEYK